ncbi:MAG TPA: non-canonical purine NTP pyrophosphatase [Ktedonobacterales bacterium]
MAERPYLLLGTSNTHKAKELRALLAGIPYEIVDLTQLDPLPEPVEDGDSFEANAMIKALAYAEASGLLTLADDSGLEIDALGGEPGVFSARWSGVGMSYPDRFRLINRRLAGVPEAERTARFRCVIALGAPPPRGLCGLTTGVVEGLIAHEPRGENGFGYDPIFLLPDRGLTMAELPEGQKDMISHRAIATLAARELLLRLAAEAHDGAE